MKSRLALYVVFLRAARALSHESDDDEDAKDADELFKLSESMTKFRIADSGGL